MKKVKLYFYNEPDGDDGSVVMCMTREEIIIEYWDYWSSKMTEKYGEGHELITEENCIQDWTKMHFAWTEEYEYEGLEGDVTIIESLDDLDDEQSRTEKHTTE